jgi:dUTP pyrophosphatase
MVYYLLHLNLPRDLPADIRALYTEAVLLHNKAIEENIYYDAGFNLICPFEIEVNGTSMAKIDLGIRGSMTYVAGAADDGAKAWPVGYFLYPRSSTGTKTPLRLANSIGIIDAGYRGNYIAAFDNIQAAVFKVDRLQRLVQICPPNLTYPMRVELVENLEQTIRGEGGFGSTGK